MQFFQIMHKKRSETENLCSWNWVIISFFINILTKETLVVGTETTEL